MSGDAGQGEKANKNVTENGEEKNLSDSKDKVIFLTQEEASEPSSVTLTEPEEVPAGLITPDGDINWNCPCLGGMAVGPCGVEFRDAFSCFHYSTSEVKGSECVEKFAKMQLCMQQYPELFEEKEGKFKDDEGDSGGKSNNVPDGAKDNDAHNDGITNPGESSTDKSETNLKVEKT